MTVTTIVARATWAARTAFESWPAWTPAVWTTVRATVGAAAIGTAATAVWTTTTAAITSTTAAALWALETRARVTADTGRITREIFTGSRGAADSRGARLTGKQDDIFLDDGWSRGNFACMGFDYFRFGVFMGGVFGVLVLGMFVFRVFSVFVHDVLGIT
jgi:hypothetical protein